MKVSTMISSAIIAIQRPKNIKMQLKRIFIYFSTGASVKYSADKKKTAHYQTHIPIEWEEYCTLFNMHYSCDIPLVLTLSTGLQL